MFRLNPRVQGVTPDLLSVYEQVMPSTIGHMTDFGFLKGLQPLFRPIRFVGNAVTVRIPHMDSSAVHKALDIVMPGDVLVIDMSGDTDRSCWGGICSYIAKAKKLAGVIVAGCVNDVQEILELQLPVFSLGVSPLTTRILGLEGEINTVISVCGVAVRPGDLIAADDDGVFVIDPNDAMKYGLKAIEIQNAETELKRKLNEGITLASISGADQWF
ncbi:Regulator of RNase E activity RraA [Paenibacillus sophorae]|uniref:Putative 4-hydroxy-4-methyl-2-oxoglutarate aldolase n=1 Tax=Paenibacillus sophorae TaxID=1333845 RepID=A0A1H8RU91_9BACL|nr:RraA family protein [Paenibacillus sophorae]QWU16961.1 RraA family protein [Paenibacillus sophorae]SEO70239.1 Regulator of RNase E activity RraA [Paenibacillus sophorae]